MNHSSIELVAGTPEYADVSFQWRSEAATLRYNPLAATNLEQFRERVAKGCSDLSDLTAASEFQFFVRVDGEVVGAVTLKNISQMMMYGEIGYTIAEKAQGRGIGTAAVHAFVDKIFRETKIRRLFAYVAEENMASRKLLEKIGFVQEGVCREHYVINGVATNEVYYGLLRKEFKLN